MIKKDTNSYQALKSLVRLLPDLGSQNKKRISWIADG
jgi:hypothetical protein